mmetsp:Transcript_113830/g.220957  ORF Transcript_113830/g.220957 Transcript_113830/m.220957 type:complete len:83 (+) Transcript_113830:14-262(+)
MCSVAIVHTIAESLIVQPGTRINENANEVEGESAQANLGGISACSPATFTHQTKPLLKVKRAIAIQVETRKYFRCGSTAFFW